MKNQHSHHMSKEELNETYKIFFGTLVSHSRLNIINSLRKGPKNVSELVNETKTDQTAVSHDLQRLKTCGFVLVETKGKYRYYKLNKDITTLMKLIDEHMNTYCVHILHHKKGGKP